jgi:hypothetical protein
MVIPPFGNRLKTAPYFQQYLLCFLTVPSVGTSRFEIMFKGTPRTQFFKWSFLVWFWLSVSAFDAQKIKRLTMITKSQQEEHGDGLPKYHVAIIHHEGLS